VAKRLAVREKVLEIARLRTIDGRIIISVTIPFQIVNQTLLATEYAVPTPSLSSGADFGGSAGARMPEDHHEGRPFRMPPMGPIGESSRGRRRRIDIPHQLRRDVVNRSIDIVRAQIGLLADGIRVLSDYFGDMIDVGCRIAGSCDPTDT